MSTRGGWYAEQSRSNPDLFRVIFDYNRRPQHWVHGSVLEAIPHLPVVKALAASRHGSGHLAAWLLQELKLLDHTPCWDFEDPRRRLHLLSSETLARLARFCGAALTWPKITSIISKAELQEVKAGLGEDAHAFALRRGRMVVAEKDTLLPDRSQPLVDHAIQVGWALVQTAALDDNPALKRRFELKLPPGKAQPVAQGFNAEQRESAWLRVRKITPEVLTEGEQKCFA